MLGVAVEVEPGEGAEGAGLEGGVRVGEGDGGVELGVGLGGARRAGEQQAQSDARGGEERVGVDGLAVAGLGVRRVGSGVCGGCGGGRRQSFEGEAEVVEDLGVVGGLGVEGGEDLEGGGEVAVWAGSGSDGA